MIYQTLSQKKVEPRSNQTYITEALRGTGGSGMKIELKQEKLLKA